MPRARACAGGPRLHAALFTLTVLPLAAVPWINGFPVSSVEHIVNFTSLMRYGGMACIPLLLLVIASLGRHGPLAPAQLPLRGALICAISLFAGGGIMGFMIRGSNTVIPAHYHGSIVGVTLAYMGVVYLLLPRLGRPLTMLRTAHWQPYVYGLGQVMHITALAWTGGHGVQAQDRGRRAGPAQPAGDHRHGTDGARRDDRGDRRGHVPGGRARGTAARSAGTALVDRYRPFLRAGGHPQQGGIGEREI